MEYLVECSRGILEYYDVTYGARVCVHGLSDENINLYINQTGLETEE